MFQPKTAFTGFSVNDLAKAKEFYTHTLGLKVVEEGAGLTSASPRRRHSPCLSQKRPPASHIHNTQLRR